MKLLIEMFTPDSLKQWILIGYATGKRFHNCTLIGNSDHGHRLLAEQFINTATVTTIQQMKLCVNSDSYGNSWLAIVHVRLQCLNSLHGVTMVILVNINIGFTTPSLVKLYDTLIYNTRIGIIAIQLVIFYLQYLTFSAEQYDINLVKPQYLFLIPSNSLTTINTVNSKAQIFNS